MFQQIAKKCFNSKKKYKMVRSLDETIWFKRMQQTMHMHGLSVAASSALPTATADLLFTTLPFCPHHQETSTSTTLSMQTPFFHT